MLSTPVACQEAHCVDNNELDVSTWGAQLPGRAHVGLVPTTEVFIRTSLLSEAVVGSAEKNTDFRVRQQSSNLGSTT